MTSQINGLNQAVRNANDGQSLIQTAEGALDESTNILQRMRELSIQSANGTYDDGNRSTLNAEAKQLIAELDRIAETTSFNGQNVLDGTLGAVALQVGSEANQTIDLEIGKLDSKSLGGGVSGDLMGSEITEASISIAAGDIQVNGHALGAYDNTAAGTNVEDLVAAFNAVDGISASTYLEETATNKGSGILVAGTDELEMTLTLADGTEQTYKITDTDNMDELVAKINDTTGGAIAASTDADGKLVLASDVGVKLVIGGTDPTGATGDLEDKEARLLLSSDSGEGITIEGNKADLAALGFNERSASGEIEGADITSSVAFSAGDLTINGVEIGASKSASVEDKVAAINDVDAGVTASAFTSREVTAFTSGSTNININGTDFDISGLADETAPTEAELKALAVTINAATDSTGVTASVQGSSLVMEGGSALKFGEGATAAAALTAAGADTGSELGIKLASDDGTDISVQLSQTDLSGAKARTGLLETNHSDTNSVGGSVANINISTAKGAQQAIEVIDKALDQINSTRGDLGAAANRLDFTVSNLSNVAENVSEARSRIEDADFAQESANLSRAQVLQQAGTAMLAQANAAPQQVLSLLQ